MSRLGHGSCLFGGNTLHLLGQDRHTEVARLNPLNRAECQRLQDFFLLAYGFKAACSLLPIIGTNAKGFLSRVLASSLDD